MTDPNFIIEEDSSKAKEVLVTAACIYAGYRGIRAIVKAPFRVKVSIRRRNPRKMVK